MPLHSPYAHVDIVPYLELVFTAGRHKQLFAIIEFVER